MFRSFACAAILLAAGAAQPAPPPGYTATVTVSAPTRIDWTFAVTSRSLADPPADLLAKDYDSAKQAYELFLPPRKDPKQPVPAVVFISAGDAPAGWKAFEPACKALGFAFVGVRDAGNNVPPPKRVRIVLDCLDDLRRQVPLDPDRTYLSGFSGGGRIACGIAFALPEYFGGVLPVGAGGDIRDESYLRHRAADRLSAALVVGQNDFNRGEVERWKAPFWTALGVRTKVWVVPNAGHAMPPSATLQEALKWLDDGKDRRAAAAKKILSSRAANDPPTRESAAAAMLKDGQSLLAGRATQHRGLMLVKGVFGRWPDTAAGKSARKLLEEYDAKPDRPWEADDIAEQRAHLTAEAKAIGDYALNGVPKGSPYEKSRPAMAKRALDIWNLLIADSPDSDAAKEGKKHVAELKKLADNKD